MSKPGLDGSLHARIIVVAFYERTTFRDPIVPQWLTTLRQALLKEEVTLTGKRSVRSKRMKRTIRPYNTSATAFQGFQEDLRLQADGVRVWH
jgi:hypothetical protein